MAVDDCFFCSSMPASCRRRSRAWVAARDSLSLAAREPMPSTVVLNCCNNSKALPADSMLLTILFNFRNQPVQLIDRRVGTFHGDEQVLQILLLKFAALGIRPVLFGLLPMQAQFFGQGLQSCAAGVHLGCSGFVVCNRLDDSGSTAVLPEGRSSA